MSDRTLPCSRSDPAGLGVDLFAPEHFLQKMYGLGRVNAVSSLKMTREQAIRKRDKLAARLSSASEVLRGSLLQRTVRHSSGCQKCARGEGHPLWVLNVGYPGGKTRQVSLRPGQVPEVRKAIEHYREFKQGLEAISELNQFLLRLDREESKEQERES
ncbi:MAG TPA: DUF6788 family protein [Bryobacteraceae bacterium]